MFGPQVPVWTVLDQSERGQQAGHYDILYVDKNADGNLLDEGERFEGTYDSQSKLVEFSLGGLRDPGSGWVYGMFSGEHEHSDWTVSVSAGLNPEVQTGMRMDGNCWISGPAKGKLVFSKTKLEAPVQSIKSGFLNFEMIDPKDSWRVGEAVELRVQLRTEAKENAQTCLMQHRSLPAETPVQFRLHYKNSEGEKKVYESELTERVGLHEFYGTVQIPADAQPGSAQIKLHLPGKPLNGSDYRHVKTAGGEDMYFSPTQLKIELTDH